MQASKPRSHAILISVFVALGIWLIALFIALGWFQSQYVHSFTHQQPNFIQSSFTQNWFKQLQAHLPPKQTDARVIQLWLPDCLCNRFARPHATKANELSKQLGYEHITLIPVESSEQIEQLQTLNPDTHIIPLSSDLLEDWPATPSVLIEGAMNQLMYIGPLGFGAFCSQATTSVIESQLQGISDQTASPFFNQIGKGCFCPWPTKK
ncbi:MAG: hypothetical protein HWE18_14900 [Gammaproteobacteria bacterium]|nr:hypothetical protein [Gammaproteobacteria bacterium]